MGTQGGSTSGSAPKGFDRVPHLRYRLFLPSIVGLQTLAVYDAVLSHAWRQETYGPEALTKHAAKGFIVSQVSQENLAQITGLERARISGHIKRLAQLGWLTVVPQQSRRHPALYELGVRRTERGAWAEATYAEAVMSRWYDTADKKAKEVYGSSYRKLAPQIQLPLVRLVVGVVPPLHNKLHNNLHNKNSSKNTDLGTKVPSSTLDLLHNNQAASYADDEPNKIKHLEEENGGSNPSLLCSHSTMSCAPTAQQKGRDHTSNGEETLANTDFSGFYIDSLHRISLTTFGKSLRTTYEDPSSHVVRSASSAASPASGTADVADSLRSPASPAFPDSASQTSFAFGGYTGWPHASLLIAAAHPAYPNPSPVPRAPSPVPATAFAFAAAGKPQSKSGVPAIRSDAGSVGSPQMPVGTSNPSTPPPSPSETPEVSPAGQGSASTMAASAIADLASVVEAAKARSRAAVEAKLAKQRTKERKLSNLTSDGGYRAQKAGAMRLEQVWREEMAQAFPHVPQFAWFKRERNKVVARKEGKLVADLLDGYGDESLVADLMRTFLRHWAEFCVILNKPSGSIPTLGFFFACHATVAAESIRLRQNESAIHAYEQWKQQNATNPFAVPPADLEANYKAALAKTKKKVP